MKMYANFVNSIFNFIANGIFGSSNSRAFLKIAIDFSNTYGIPLGGLFLVKLQAAYLPFGGSGRLRGCFSSILLILLFILCKRLFLGNCS